jgi:hypothetical protein
LASNRQKARRRRFAVDDEERSLAQRQLDLFRDALPKTEEPEPRREADRGEDGKTVPDPSDA